MKRFGYVFWVVLVLITISVHGHAQQVIISETEARDLKLFKDDVKSDKSKYYGRYRYDPGYGYRARTGHGPWTQYELFINLANGLQVTYWEGENFEETRTGKPIGNTSLTGNLLQGILSDGTRFVGKFVTISLDRGRTRIRGIVRTNARPLQFYQFID